MAELTRRSILATLPALALAGLGASTVFADPTAGDAGLMSYFKSSYDAGKGEYALPKLPYEYNALEPHIDAQTMELHHSKHHNAFVTYLNTALKALKELDYANADGRVVEALQRDLSFNAGGHVMHTIFWGVMAPNCGGPASGKIGGLIDSTFGNFENFKTYFTKVAMSIKGSGWAVLCQDLSTGRLMTSAMGDQDTRLIAGTLPLLAIDVWEHAYYLKYQNKRADYVAAWFNTINWSAVNTLAIGAG